MVMAMGCPEFGGGEHGSSAMRTGAKEGAFLPSLTGLVTQVDANPPLETAGYYRSSLRDFSAGDGLARLRTRRNCPGKAPPRTHSACGGVAPTRSQH